MHTIPLDRLIKLIAANDLDAFRRYPSELRAYIAWTHKTKAQYKNMTNYLCQKRLQWDPRPPELGGSTFEYRNSVPYADERDFKVLFNDWPYGFTPDIKHLVCWSKTPVAAKPETGEITDESRAIIEAFVDRYFCKRLREKYGSSENRIVWFKNWTKLQSVRAIEHFHVLVRDVDKELLAEWTNGDERDLSVLKLES